MARRYDARKDAEWGKRLKRFRRSGLTVARFCAEEHVSVASFYYWYKKLGQTASRRPRRSRSGLFRQVAVVPTPPAMAPDTYTGVPARRAMAWHTSAVDRDTPGVLPEPPEVIATTGTVAPAGSARVSSSSRVVIQFPCGTRIEMDGGHHDLVRAVVGEVMRAHAGVQTGIRSC